MMNAAVAQQQETTDSAAIAQIRNEGMNNSQAMETLSYLTDVYGPRLTGSTGLVKAEEWAKDKLASWGLQKAHLEAWGPFGKGWTLEKYSANVISRQNFPLLSYPRAWSPGTNGNAKGDIIYLDAKTDSALNTFKGKLKGAFVLIGDTRELEAHWDPEATREADSSLLKLANAGVPIPRQRRGPQNAAGQNARAILDYEKIKLCEKEGALALLSISPAGDGGNMQFVQQARVPAHPDTPFVKRISAYDKNAPKILPQIYVNAEHFNRLVRMIQKGEKPKLEMNLDVKFNPADSCYNVIAEIPGTDLADEVVMIGAHVDSWHAATGATDNGTGSTVCMEAMRILKTLNLKPRRTIRIALWSGEEQGEFGSSAYVKEHFGEQEAATTPGGQRGPVKLKPEADKFSVYFNDDNGTGKFRGIYMEGNEAARPIFRKWFEPFAGWGASTLTLASTGSTDHEPFKAIGLPGFQFIQDGIEYFTRSWHSSNDFYDRVLPEDMKQSAVMMATLAYNAAMRDEKFPRKPLPQPQSTGAPGSH